MVKTYESRVPPSPTLDKVNVGFDKLIDNRAHGHYTLVGSPSLRTGTQPPSCLYLDNRLYIIREGII